MVRRDRRTRRRVPGGSSIWPNTRAVSFRTPCLFHLDPEGRCPRGYAHHTGEHRGATEVTGDTGDHFLDEHGLADAGAAEQADLSTLDVGVRRSMLLMPVSSISVEPSRDANEGALRWMGQRSVICRADSSTSSGLAQHVEDVSLDAVADGHGDGRAGVLDHGAADEAVGRLERDRPDQVVAEVLRGLEGDHVRLTIEGDLAGQRVVDCGGSRQQGTRRRQPRQ
jgi:hypothetical protein